MLRRFVMLSSIFLIISFYASFLLASTTDNPLVKVSLQSLNIEKKLTLKSEKEFGLYDLNSNTLIQRIPMGRSVELNFESGTVLVGDRKLRGVYATSTAEVITLSTDKISRSYRGWLVIEPGEGKLSVINELPLEDYLLGVVPCEMPSSWPIECLKAQAIAARTYALSRALSRANERFYLVDTVMSQVYRGFDVETPRTNNAVRETRGKVLTFAGRPISAMYSADAGGISAGFDEVFSGNGVPYLISKPDTGSNGKPYSSGSKYAQWDLKLDKPRIEEILASKNFQLGEFKGMEILEKGASGRVTSIKVTCEKGELILKGNEFRNLIGVNVLRSTLFDVASNGEEWVLTGRGWGHGVGMCQAGAKGRAEAGQNYLTILSAYYPNTELSIASALSAPLTRGNQNRIKHRESKS
jgi:stage II sporulation protein D